VPTALVLADFCFVAGAVMDVVLSYFYFERSSEYNLTLARVFGFSTLLWLLSSLLYLLVTLALQCYSGEDSCRRKESPQAPLRKEVEDTTFNSPLPTYSMTSSTSVLEATWYP
jgi:hypothetical protein